MSTCSSFRDCKPTQQCYPNYGCRCIAEFFFSGDECRSSNSPVSKLIISLCAINAFLQLFLAIAHVSALQKVLCPRKEAQPLHPVSVRPKFLFHIASLMSCILLIVQNILYINFMRDGVRHNIHDLYYSAYGPYNIGTVLVYLSNYASIGIISLYWYGIAVRDSRQGTGEMPWGRFWRTSYIFINFIMAVAITYATLMTRSIVFHLVTILLCVVCGFAGLVVGLYAIISSGQSLKKSSGPSSLKDWLLNRGEGPTQGACSPTGSVTGGENGDAIRMERAKRRAVRLALQILLFVLAFIVAFVIYTLSADNPKRGMLTAIIWNIITLLFFFANMFCFAYFYKDFNSTNMFNKIRNYCCCCCFSGWHAQIHPAPGQEQRRGLISSKGKLLLPARVRSLLIHRDDHSGPIRVSAPITMEMMTRGDVRRHWVEHLSTVAESCRTESRYGRGNPTSMNIISEEVAEVVAESEEV